MRRLLALVAPLLIVAATPAEAALSPFYDSGEKIDTIISSPELGDALHQAPIRSIENTGTRADGADEWLVRTQDCDLTVYLVAVPPDGPGMTTYRLELPNTCK